MSTALTVFLANAASATISTANQLYHSGSGSPAAAQPTTTMAAATGYGEILAQGGTAWAASGSAPTPSGKGFFLDDSTLDGQDLVSGSWTAEVRYVAMQSGAQAGSMTADIHVRVYRYRPSSTTYTQIIDMALTGQTINDTLANYSLSGSTGSAISFATGDRLYVDYILNITAGSGNVNQGVRINRESTDTSTHLGDILAEVVTPGFQASVGPATASTAPTSLTFAGVVGGSNPASQSVTLSNVGVGSDTWTVNTSYGSGSGWLSLTPTSGSLGPGNSVDVSFTAITGNLAAGMYTATTTFTLGSSTATVSTTFTVSTGVPTIAASGTLFFFTGTAGDDNPAAQYTTLSNTGNATGSWTSSIAYANGSGWLSVAPTFGSLVVNGMQFVAIGCTIAGLAPGTYGATITLTMASSTATVIVTLTLSSPVPYSAVVDGSPVFIQAGSLNIDSTIGKRSQASFTARTTTATHFYQDQQVQVYDQFGDLAFNGYVGIEKEQKPGFRSSLVHLLQCVDMHRLADKRRIVAAFINKTCGYIAQYITNTILAQEGVTIGQIFDGLAPSPTLYPSDTLYPSGNIGLIPSAIFAYAKCSDALDALAKQASNAGVPYYWQIDYNKRLWFVPYTAVINSKVVDGSQIDQKYRLPVVQRQNPTYRNTQYIVGGVAQTVQQTETRKGDGNTVAWAMGYDLAQAPTISVDSTAKTVGTKGTTGFDYYWQQGDATITQDSAATKLTSSNTLQVVYIGQYPSVIIAQNNAQISYVQSLDGTSGIVEDVTQDTSITSLDAGFSEASQLLDRYARQGVQLQFSTLQTGFAQGQLITVDLPAHDLNNAQMLIENVNASDQLDNYNIWYTITAVLGPYDVTWQDFFSALLKQQQPASAISVGVAQTVTTLQSFAVTIAPTLNLTVSGYSCPLPSTTLYPSDTLYPC